MLYEKQEDCTLKPTEYPEQLVKKVAIYKWLRSSGYEFEEIKFLINWVVIF